MPKQRSQAIAETLHSIKRRAEGLAEDAADLELLNAPTGPVEDVAKILMAWVAAIVAESPQEPGLTFPEWCALNGTTTEEMAEAQERHAADDGTSTPIGRCPDCGAPIYTVPGFCRCERN